MNNNNLCTKEKINILEDSITKYNLSYTKYLIDKEEINSEKEEIEQLIKDKNFELLNNLMKKDQDTIEIKCDTEDPFKDCYLKCKKKHNPTDRKPDVFIFTQCKKDNLNNEKSICECYIPDYKSIDDTIGGINNLLKKKLDILEKEYKLVKPEYLTLKSPCCSKDIECLNGKCSSIDELCKVQPVVESFTKINNNKLNINHILIIIIIILIIFFMCQK